MADKGESRGAGRSGNKADRGGSGTLGSGSDFTSYGPAGGYRDGGRDEGGNKMGAIADTGRRGGMFGNIAPGRLAGGLLGSLFGGPIGGLIGAGIGGRLTGQNWGYTDAQGNRVSGLRDRFDGGGRGRAGDRFEGGLLSGIGNGLGIRPAGYEDRQAQMSADQVRAGISSAGGIPPVGVTDLTGTSASLPLSGYVPIDIAGPVRDLPAVQPAPIPMSAQPGALSPPPIDFGVVPLASQRYLDQFGMAQLAPTNPAMLPRAQPSLSDLENFLSGVPDNPMTGVPAPSLGPVNLTPGVSVGGTDPITFRNNLSAANLGFMRQGRGEAGPYADTQSYRAGMAPAAMSQTPMGRQLAGLDYFPGLAPGVDVGAPARTPPSMFQQNLITGTRGAGGMTNPTVQPAPIPMSAQPGMMSPPPDRSQSFDRAAARAAAQRMRDEVQRRRMNLGVYNPLVFNN